MRRILIKHYHPGPGDRDGPSWLSFIAHLKDSLWSIDMFCCESGSLKTRWVLVVMDMCSRKIIGFSVCKGSVDGPTLCRMFNQIISRKNTPLCVNVRTATPLSISSLENQLAYS